MREYHREFVVCHIEPVKAGDMVYVDFDASLYMNAADGKLLDLQSDAINDLQWLRAYRHMFSPDKEELTPEQLRDEISMVYYRARVDLWRADIALVPGHLLSCEVEQIGMLDALPALIEDVAEYLKRIGYDSERPLSLMVLVSAQRDAWSYESEYDWEWEVARILPLKEAMGVLFDAKPKEQVSAI